MAGATGKMNGLSTGGLIDLAVVLACGFILCAWEPWRGYVRRQPSPVPYFTFLAVGVVWWVTVAALMPALARACGWSHICIPTLGAWMGLAVDRQHDVNILFSAILLSIILRLCAEKIWRRVLQLRNRTIFKRILKRSEINLKGLELEKMIAQAVNEGSKIMLTLRSRKVYVGDPSELSRDDSGREKWISITPWKSGYRCEKTGMLTLTTNYGRMRGLGARGEVKYFPVCIPIREVVSCQFFDQNLFDRFQSEETRTEAGGGEADSEGGERTEELKQGVAETRSARPANNAEERKQGANKQ